MKSFGFVANETGLLEVTRKESFRHLRVVVVLGRSRVLILRLNGPCQVSRLDLGGHRERRSP